MKVQINRDALDEMRTSTTTESVALFKVASRNRPAPSATMTLPLFSSVDLGVLCG